MSALGSSNSPEKDLQTSINIEGVAPSDLEVASYIEKLSSSILYSSVALVESREFSTKDKKPEASQKFRHFKLTASIRKELNISRQDVEKIAQKGDLFLIESL